MNYDGQLHLFFRRISAHSSLQIRYKGETVFSQIIGMMWINPSENPEDPSSWEVKVNKLYERAQNVEAVT